LRKIGEDVTETLELIPRQWKVIQHVREKFSCRACEAISQPPAPSQSLARGRAGPTRPYSVRQVRPASAAQPPERCLRPGRHRSRRVDARRLGRRRGGDPDAAGRGHTHSRLRGQHPRSSRLNDDQLIKHAIPQPSADAYFTAVALPRLRTAASARGLRLKICEVNTADRGCDQIRRDWPYNIGNSPCFIFVGKLLISPQSSASSRSIPAAILLMQGVDVICSRSSAAVSARGRACC
jgi:zinc-finger binding domain of transposase IS66